MGHCTAYTSACSSRSSVRRENSALDHHILFSRCRIAPCRQTRTSTAESIDLVVLLTISNTVQNAIIGDDNSVTGGIIGAATLLLVNYLFVRFLYSHPKADELVEGSPDVLIENGKVLPDRLRKELILHSELEAAAHKQGFGSLDEVDRAVLDPGGSISFTAKKPGPDESRHNELLKKIEELSRQLSTMRTSPDLPTA